MGLVLFLCFTFACFDLQNKFNWLRTVKLFERATVVHMLEVGMNEDCRELVCGLSKEH